MRIDLLCSGSKGNSCLIRTQSTCIMIDCGPSSRKYMQSAMDAAGCAAEDIQALFLTHSNSDHVKQIQLFESVPVYAPFRQSDLKNSGNARWNLITDQKPFALGDLEIRPVFLSHDAGPTAGFVIRHEINMLVYITDTGYIRQEEYDSLSGADWYIFESNHDISLLQMTNRPFWLKHRIACDTGHLCNEDAARILCRLITEKTSRIVLAHLSEEANTPQLALDTFKERFAREFPGRTMPLVQTAGQYETLTIDSGKDAE